MAGEEWKNVNNMLLIYSPVVTPRLEYIVQLLMEALGVEYKIIENISTYEQNDDQIINYTSEAIGTYTLHLVPARLLFENKIQEQHIDTFTFNELKAFYQTQSADFPFDIFAASFYLISRYEEYLPHAKDAYGRYAHENSLASREGFLHQPLVNLWLQQFKTVLRQKFPQLTFHPKPFTFIPTYDIDIAWNYLNKGIVRNIAGALRSMVNGQWSMVKERLTVLQQKDKDPFHIYEWLDNLHKQHNLHPVYFFLLAERQAGYDKNISFQKRMLQQLIVQHAGMYEVGIHPSWKSGDDATLLQKEIDRLKSITGANVKSSRQHYIRMKQPDSYRQLISAGIEKDYSMGYGSTNGFRASYCLPYKWYDLQKEEVTSLTVYPFCYMEANSYYEQHYSLEQATKELDNYYLVTKHVDGLLITIMHNHLLGNKVLFNGWKEMYASFLQKQF